MIQINHKHIDIFANEHYEAIKQHLNKKRVNKFDDVDNWFRSNGMRIGLKDVILAKHDDLELIKTAYFSTTYDNNALYLKHVYNKYFTYSKNVLGENSYNSAQLIQKLDVKVCPYCNRNYINNINFKGKRGYKRTSQLDHFFSKEKYPFLSMSFYNLIPSCPSCNHTKHTNDIGVSPYDRSMLTDKLVDFNFHIISSSLSNEYDIEVIMRNLNKKYYTNNETLGLDSLYKVHRDTVYDLVKKTQMYPESKLEEIKNIYPTLFKNDNEMKRLLYGNYVSQGDEGKRPLGKLSKDIYLKLINI